MTVSESTLWYGIYGRPYEGGEPAFFDPQDMPWADYLRSHYPVIKSALMPLMHSESGDLKPYFDEVLQFPPRNWKTIGFYFWGKRDYRNMNRFPELAAVLDKIPGLVTASFNMLEPHSRIKPHFGETNAVYRVHLGVSVPDGLPACGFTVKGESAPWVEGDLLVFLDANTHEAFNNTNARRYILLLDIMRPEYVKRTRQICVKALSMLSLYFLIAMIPGFPTERLHRNAHRIPKWLIDGVLLLPFKLIWSVYWPLHRRFDMKRFVGI